MAGVVIIESPVENRVTIDIKATAIEHRYIIPDLLAAHALSGCDTTACYFGICNIRALLLKHFKHRNHLFPH